jgi:hypothetical protein
MLLMRKAGVSQDRRVFHVCGLRCCTIAGNQLDRIGLAAGAGFLKQAVQVSSDRRLRNPEYIGNLGHATDLDDGKKHPQFRRRQLKLLGNGYRRGRQIERRLANEHRRYRAVADAGLAPRSEGQR